MGLLPGDCGLSSEPAGAVNRRRRGLAIRLLRSPARELQVVGDGLAEQIDPARPFVLPSYRAELGASLIGVSKPASDHPTVARRRVDRMRCEEGHRGYTDTASALVGPEHPCATAPDNQGPALGVFPIDRPRPRRPPRQSCDRSQ